MYPPHTHHCQVIVYFLFVLLSFSVGSAQVNPSAALFCANYSNPAPMGLIQINLVINVIK